MNKGLTGNTDKFRLTELKVCGGHEGKNGQPIITGFCYLDRSLLINPKHMLRSLPGLIISKSNSIVLTQQKPWEFCENEESIETCEPEPRQAKAS